MNITERRFLERLAAALEDEQQVDKAYMSPMGQTRAYQKGFRDGARMQAKAAAMAIRGLIGAPAEESVVAAEEVGHMSAKQYEVVKTMVSRIDPDRIKRRGIR